MDVGQYLLGEVANVLTIWPNRPPIAIGDLLYLSRWTKMGVIKGALSAPEAAAREEIPAWKTFEYPKHPSPYMSNFSILSN